ncbi:hydantoinase B/oxoprolinase family protein [Desulfogranum japonicum]|uniref:hydantoinase B/oxoprolinase family protein n=1 Tax=Desulfogranum japonicum TaxID=231447 RepID=UPI0004215537|nr:hydantoinase B/oxoprolinase family protein [Desulfogranum japonicum]
MGSKYQFWIDRGGTFTDIVAKHPDSSLSTCKLLSENPEQYEDAAIAGIKKIMGLARDKSIPAELVSSVKMGTTVATNALLERKGSRTLLIITKGFKDALRIGYQNRPDLFARHILLPELLYEAVIEAEERVDASGNVLTPLHLEKLRPQLQHHYHRGIRSVAICLMHGYQFHDHESRIFELAYEIGYTQISASHEVSPLMKLVSRGDTTVVDAYLSPILRNYVDQVSKEIDTDSTNLMFMQSNGGLTDASIFRGKDAILSGPAGGVVGMVRTGEMSSFHKLIGFDMGGTSTDVAHYDGEFERSFETMVAGIRMRAPMMYIHTVAAGGGSILHFDGARYRVGPESAGAEPGPACYRKGGPLTVTDCNVMLGKIQPHHFPAVFGPHANQPLDKKTVIKQFELLTQRIEQESDSKPASPEAVAEGFLRIAVENMAHAIKTISVQRGYDVTEYTLNCFGGAGGQHACQVADALGMTQVFLHPYAGVLSAYGMGLADVSAMREQQVELDLITPNLSSHLAKILPPLQKEVYEEVHKQGVAGSDISITCKIHLRYKGTDTSLLIDQAPPDTMQRQFEHLHQQRFGYVPLDRELVIEAVSVEAIGKAEHLQDIEVKESFGSPVPLEQVRMYTNGKYHHTFLYNRDQFLPGQAIKGPAILIETTGTIVVEEGWKAEINGRNHLIMTRYLPRPVKEAIGTQNVDPVMLEVFNNLFMSIAEQMGATLANTAYSVNIKERLDFSCALFDAAGNLVANAPHIPVHLGSMGESIKAVIQANSGVIEPGDVYMLNDPYNGGSHLPDVTVITPFFDSKGRDILFYLGSRGHHADIGGRTPGSSPPDSTHIEQEGVLIENWLLVKRGRLRDRETRTLLASGPFPCRNIDQNMADLAAQIAANETGVQELQKMVDHFGLEVVKAYMAHVQDNAEEAVRCAVTTLKDCSFTYPMDDGSKIKVSIKVDHKKRSAVIDFNGTSPQHKGNYNAPESVCRAAVLYVFRTLVNDDIPLNAGCLKPLDIRIPKGSMISPVYPAAVISGNTEVSQAVTDTLFAALGILASSQGTMNNFLYGNEHYQNYETICGGTGAGPDHPGTSAVHSHMTNTRMTDPEVIEHRFPVLVEEFSIRRHSGGPGHFAGGDGVVRKIRFLESMTATVLSSHRKTAPFGLAGGGDGLCGNNYIIRVDGTFEQLHGNDEATMRPGDVFILETPGGGGYGPPDANS